MTESDSSTRPRWRPRISLVSALLLMTIVGMGIVIVKLWSEVGPLRSEVRRLRDETGVLSIDDPSKVHAIQVRKADQLVWKWRLWLPEGRTYVLRTFGGDVPHNGFPTTGGTVTVSGPGEVWVEYRITKDPHGQWRGRMITPTGAVGAHNQEWVDWGNRIGTGDGIGTTTKVSEPDAILVLNREYYGQAVKNSRDIPNPAPGFMIWLEPR